MIEEMTAFNDCGCAPIEFNEETVELLNLGSYLACAIRDVSTDRPISLSDCKLLLLAKKFKEFVNDEKDGRITDREFSKFVKETLCDKKKEQVARFILKGDYADLTDVKIVACIFTFESAGACLKLSCYRKLHDSEERVPGVRFLADDLLGMSDCLVIVDKLESCVYGAGRVLLDKTVRSLNGIPIALEAGFLHYGEHLEAEQNLSKYDAKLEQLVQYYKNSGFEDINWFCGFEACIAMFNSNNSGVEIKI